MQRIEHYELTTNSDVFALNSLQKAMMLRPCGPTLALQAEKVLLPPPE